MAYAANRFQIVANPALYEFNVGDRLRKLLSVNSYSVEGIAAQLHVSRNTIGNYLSGRTVPDHRTLALLAGMFAVPIEWLRDGIWPSEWHEAYVDAVRAENGLPPLNAETAPAFAETVSDEECTPWDSNPEPTD